MKMNKSILTIFVLLLGCIVFLGSCAETTEQEAPLTCTIEISAELRIWGNSIQKLGGLQVNYEQAATRDHWVPAEGENEKLVRYIEEIEPTVNTINERIKPLGIWFETPNPTLYGFNDRSGCTTKSVVVFQLVHKPGISVTKVEPLILKEDRGTSFLQYGADIGLILDTGINPVNEVTIIEVTQDEYASVIAKYLRGGASQIATLHIKAADLEGTSFLGDGIRRLTIKEPTSKVFLILTMSQIGDTIGTYLEMKE